LLTELFAPHRHIAVAVCAHIGSPINIRCDIRNRELTASPLRNLGQIGWWGPEFRGNRPISPALHAMAGTTVGDVKLVSHSLNVTRRGIVSLSCCDNEREKKYKPPALHHHVTPLHRLPPVLGRFWIGIALPYAYPDSPDTY
jgi:hypothetical protein